MRSMPILICEIICSTRLRLEESTSVNNILLVLVEGVAMVKGGFAGMNRPII